MGAVPDDEASHIKFHLEVTACRFCQANAADLRRAEEETLHEVQTRRRKYFQSSAGYLRKKK